MTLKHIRSPRDTDLYPLRVRATHVTPGQQVRADTPAFELETAQGRVLLIRAAIDGRVDMALPEGTVLASPQPILSVETSPAPPKAESAAAEPPRETHKPKPKPAPEPPPEPEPAKDGAGKPRRGLFVVAGLAVAALLGVGLYQSGKYPNIPGESLTTSTSAKTTGKPRSDFPTAEDRAWLSAPQLETVNRFSGGFLTTGRFLNLDVARNGDVKLVGRMDGKGFVTTLTADSKTLSERKFVDFFPDAAFILADVFYEDDSAVVGFTKADDHSPTLFKQYSAKANVLTGFSPFFSDLKIVSADHDGDYMVLLGAETFDEEEDDWMTALFGSAFRLIGMMRGGKAHMIELSQLSDTFDESSVFTYAGVDASYKGYGSVFLTTIEPGYQPFEANWGEYSLFGDTDGGPPQLKFEYLNEFDLGLLPTHVPRDFMDSPIDDMPFGGVSLAGMTVASDDTTYAMGGAVAGLNVAGSSEENPAIYAFAVIGDANDQFKSRLFARNDPYRDEGLRVQAIEGLDGGRFAVLLREAGGAPHPFGAIVILDAQARVLARENFNGVYMEALKYHKGTLHAAGYRVTDEGTEVPAYRAYRP